MSYELLALPVPPGAEIEEAGEALEVRLAGGHVFHDHTAAGEARRRALVAAAVSADPTLVEQSGEDGARGAEGAEGKLGGRVVLAAADGIDVEIDAAFAVFRIAYSCAPSDAEVAFERLFRVAGAIVRETGWSIYDPQEARAVGAGDDGRDATLEIFLSVLDHLRGVFDSDPR